MDLKITNDKIENPLLVELLKKLTDSFNLIERDFYVIGATARDIIIRQLINTSSGRKTNDLDIAIGISDWNVYEEIKDILVAEGFTKDVKIHHRLYYNGYELDIVPYGIAKDDDNIFWPPEEDIAMSVKGFKEVMSKAIIININDEFEIKIASLQGLFVLKLNAWLARNAETNKDAEDMSFILSNYFQANLDRNPYDEVYNWEDFDEYIVGAYWLACDLLSILNIKQIVYFKDCIEKELEKDVDSRLFNQMIECSRGVISYETVKGAWQCIADVFKEAIDKENKL